MSGLHLSQRYKDWQFIQGDEQESDMTREEKIALLVDELEDIRCDNFDADTNEDKTLKEAVRVIKTLEQETCEDEYIKVPKKALKYRTAGMVAYNAEWLKSHFDIERAIICGAQEPCSDTVSRQAVEDKLLKLCNELEGIFANIRIEKQDDSVCNLCEYDCPSPYECPGFDIEDCFKLADEIRHKWQSTKELSAVNPQEPKMGHWSRKTKVDAYDIAGVKTWGIKCQCDRCDFTTIVVEDFGYYNYCPNCGCRMVEPQETQESDHKCHTCKHYISGEHDGSCGSYICKGYSNWESEVSDADSN